MTAATGSDYRILPALQHRQPNQLHTNSQSPESRPQQSSLGFQMLRAVRRNALRSTIAAKALAASRGHRGGVQAGGHEGQVV